MTKLLYVIVIFFLLSYSLLGLENNGKRNQPYQTPGKDFDWLFNPVKDFINEMRLCWPN